MSSLAAELPLFVFQSVDDVDLNMGAEEMLFFFVFVFDMWEILSETNKIKKKHSKEWCRRRKFQSFLFFVFVQLFENYARGIKMKVTVKITTNPNDFLFRSQSLKKKKKVVVTNAETRKK